MAGQKKKCLLPILVLATWLALAGSCLAAEPVSVDSLSRAQRRVLARADESLQQNRPLEAVGILEEFLGSEKKAASGSPHALVYFFLGNAYARADQNEQAIQAYGQAVKQSPGWPPARLNLARLLFETGQYKKAATAFEKAYETQEQKQAGLLYYAAASHAANGNMESAAEVFGRLLKAHPGQVEITWKESYAGWLLALERKKQALPLVEELARSSDNKTHWLQALLFLYADLGRVDRALELCGELAAQSPADPRWWKILAGLYSRQGENKQALAAWLAYGKLKPWSDEERLQAADLYLSLDVPDRAAALYVRALEKGEGAQEVWERAVMSLRLSHQEEEALLWAKKGAGRVPALRMRQGEILYGLGRYEEAMEAFERAAKKNGEPGLAWLMAGYAAWAAGDKEKAGQALEQAQKYPQTKNRAREMLQNLQGP